MRTSLIETQQIEQHILQSAQGGDKLLFQAKLMLDPSLHERVRLQKKTYAIVRIYGRKKLKEEIEAVHQQLFHSTEHQSFKKRIFRFFSHR